MGVIVINLWLWKKDRKDGAAVEYLGRWWYKDKNVVCIC